MEKLKLMFQFLQEQILGMKWMNELIGKGLSVLGVDIQGRVGGSIQFFLYDVIKITILLCLLIFIISYIQSYFPPERSKKILGRFHGIWANIISALLGTVTPFCSCSSIPIFKCRIAAWSNIFVFDIFTDGRFGKFGIVDEHLWRENCICLCYLRTCDCGNRRYAYRKNAYGNVCGRIYQKRQSCGERLP